MVLSPRYRNDRKSLLRLNDVQKAARRALIGKLSASEYETTSYPCVLCDGGPSTVLAEKDRYGIPMTVRACQGCGLVRTDPRMTDEAYAAYYDHEYRPLHGGLTDPTGPFEAQISNGELIIRFLQDANQMPAPGSLILEIGPGAGGILYAFQKIGYQVAGLDLGSEYVDFGKQKGIDLRVGTLRDWDGDAPELIMMSHVVEHLADPVGELELARSILADSGRLYVEVPSIKSMMPTYQRDFLRYLQLAHVLHFSSSTLDAVMQRAGFTRVTGNEYVRAVYHPGPVVEATPDDYAAVMRYLQESERRRRLMPVTRAGLITAAKGPAKRLLRRLGVYHQARKLVRRVH